jgi:hypothetical protein
MPCALHCFFEKFNPYRVVVYRECVSCMEIRPLQGHFLFSVNSFYNVFLVIFLLKTIISFALAEQIISTLADWHISTLSLAH